MGIQRYQARRAIEYQKECISEACASLLLAQMVRPGLVPTACLDQLQVVLDGLRRELAAFDAPKA